MYVDFYRYRKSYTKRYKIYEEVIFTIIDI